MRTASRLGVYLLALSLAFWGFGGAVASVNKLEGAAAKDAKKKLLKIRREWSKISKAQKLQHLSLLARLPERTVVGFLEKQVTKEVDDDTASEAARALVLHGNPKDAKRLTKAFNKAKTADRRAACVRWLGLYGDDAPLRELKNIAMAKDGSAVAAAKAISDIDSSKAREYLDLIAAASSNRLARIAAIQGLLRRLDDRGADAIEDLSNIEQAATAAHAAVGTSLETEALRSVLLFGPRALRLKPGERAVMWGSLLARLVHRESHEAVVAASRRFTRMVDLEYTYWLISLCKAQPVMSVAKGWLRAELDGDTSKEIENYLYKVTSGLRYLQRAPMQFAGKDLEDAEKFVTPLLQSPMLELQIHALLALAVIGAGEEKFEARVQEWLKSGEPEETAAALLAAGRAGLRDRAKDAMDQLETASWIVQSAALDCLLRLRPKAAIKAVFELAKRVRSGRIFSEAVVLLRDLTGVDHGDLMSKWEAWIKANPDFKPKVRKLETLRGVRYAHKSQRTAATFYGIEIVSENLEFALDRSVSMVNAVSREPQRADFGARKSDIMKRRPEVKRLMRDGFLPRFHVAAAELSAALDGMSQRAKFGITLFNTKSKQFKKARTENAIKDRRKAVNWMLSTDIQGGTNIKAALLEIIKRHGPDTILLLSDGDPTSLGILETIARNNVVIRVDIHVVSIHETMHHRHYLAALAREHAGQIIDAEPRD